ncbi:unnamed protein product, partial [Adineta ricciae]
MTTKTFILVKIHYFNILFQIAFYKKKYEWMDSHRLRAIILKLQDRLSDDDRKRLHFYLGNDVPRRIRDDPTLGGTLSLMESLFDQDKINENDITFLINAFDEIQCIDAVKLLREHWRQNHSQRTNQSVESLSVLMPPLINHLLEDLENDSSTAKDSVINQENTDDETSTMINTDNTNINQESIVTFSTDKFSSRSKILGSINIRWGYLFLFVLLTIIGFGILIFFIIKNFIYINHLETYNNQYIETIKQLNNRIIQLETKENFPTPTNLNPSKHYGIKIKWKPNPVIISAVNDLDRLHSPIGIYIDDDSRSIYVASWGG